MATTQPTQGDDQKKAYVPSEQISIDHGTSEVANPYAAALKLAAAHDGDDIDPLAEKKLVRKIDWFLMPLMCATYALQYYDKAIIGHAAIFGLREDLDLLEGLRYSNTTLIFYCGFIIGCYPISLLGQKFPTAKVCAVICFAWGAVVLSTLGCTSYGGFMTNRFFLGLIESGISPLFMLVTSKWYTNEEQVLRSGIWYSCSGGVNLISPLINYGLGSINGRIAGWKAMYLFAGLLTVVWAFVIWFLFPDSPATAKNLSEEERALAILRLRGNNTGFENTKLQPRQILDTLMSWQFWSVFVLSMLCTTASGASNTFASLVFKGMGFNTFHTLLLNVPMGLMAFITIIGSGYLGRTFDNMRHHIYSIACLPVIVGCCLLWQLGPENTGGRVAGVYLVTFFGSCYVQVIAFGTANFAGYTKKSVVAAGVFVAFCLGNIIGPLLFDAKYAPGYNESFTGIMICFAIAFGVCEVTRFFLARENARRDAEYGPPGISHGLEDLTEKENRDFRYKL